MLSLSRIALVCSLVESFDESIDLSVFRVYAVYTVYRHNLTCW